MRRAAAVWPLLLLLAATLGAQERPGEAKPEKAIRIGVATLRNTSRRTIATKVQRDRLVRLLNEGNRKDDAGKGRARLEAVALEADSAPAAAGEARDQHCDFLVYTNLKDLREPGDPVPVRVGPGAGDITITDPLKNPGHDPGSLNPATYAMMEFRLHRVGDPQPLVASSVSATEQMDAEATVSLLMTQVANRVATETRKTRPRPPE